MYRISLIVVLGSLLLVAVKADAGLVNGNFENGLNGWSLQDGSATLSSDAYQGLLACRVSATANQTQGLLNSSSFAVTGNRLYKLKAYVKMTSGSGLYMVAIAWRNSGGATIYHDNAWTGDNQPADYTLHEKQ